MKLHHAVLAMVAIVVVAIDILFERNTQAQIYAASITFLSWFFAFRYARYSPWRRNAGGRALMYFSVALGAVGAQIFSAWTWGSYPFRPEARAFVFGALIVVLVHLNWILNRAQRRRRAEGSDSKGTD